MVNAFQLWRVKGECVRSKYRPKCCPGPVDLNSQRLIWKGGDEMSAFGVTWMTHSCMNHLSILTRVCSESHVPMAQWTVRALGLNPAKKPCIGASEMDRAERPISSRRAPVQLTI